MNSQDIRELPEDEILAEVEKRRSEIFRLRLRAGSEDVENPGALREKRRDIARLLTILKQKQLSRAKKNV